VTVTLLRGDALHLPLADHTVDLCVTSPPYFGLRSYQDGGQHYAGQIGSEATPAEWVEAMLAATREMVRCLKPCGSIWVNLGDKYAGSPRNMPEDRGAVASGPKASPSRLAAMRDTHHLGEYQTHVRPKSLIGLPWRYALACIDQLGLILRAEVIWSKPNGLPESVTDRVRRSHEQWFHFTTQPRYFSAVDEIREPHTGGAHPSGAGASRRWTASTNGHNHRATDTDPSEYNSLGKLPGSVWTVPSQPLTVPPELGVDHFAAFPMEFPRRLIGGWSPAGICSGCGDGRQPISVAETVFDKARDQAHATEIAKRGAAHSVMSGGTAKSTLNGTTTRTITGYVCACTPKHVETLDAWPWEVTVYDWHLWTPPPTTPAVVLDGFGGTGTTALVAHVMGRHGLSIDLSADYCRLAAWRCSDPAQLAQAAQVDKPPAQTVGQDTLFEVTR
jgi:DNA modification methylase